MAKQDSVQLMTKGSIAKQIIGYAIPIFIGYLFQQLYNTVDALIVGNFLGQDALAAVTSVGSLIFCLLVFQWFCDRSECHYCQCDRCSR